MREDYNMTKKTVVETKHEHFRNEQRELFEGVMSQLDDIASSMSETQRAKEKYAILEIQCSRNVNESIGNITIDEIGDGSEEEEENIVVKRLTNCTKKIQRLSDVVISLKGCIRNILYIRYGISGSPMSEKSISLIAKRDIDFPIGLDKNASPQIGQQVITTMRGIMHSYPMQLWALLPMLERLFSDYSESNVHWSPMKTDDNTWSWKGLTKTFTLNIC